MAGIKKQRSNAKNNRNSFEIGPKSSFLSIRRVLFVTVTDRERRKGEKSFVCRGGVYCDAFSLSILFSR
jgi:hypothetical protein